MSKPLVVSMFDYTGNWARPYLEAGYDCILIDVKHPKGVRRRDGFITIGGDIRLIAANTVIHRRNHNYREAYDYSAILGRGASIVLAAPPCTDFANSGAQWWGDKDRSGETARSVRKVLAALQLKDWLRPKVWALENPKGRIAYLAPEIGDWKLAFDPCDYAGFADDPASEAYTKETFIYGQYNTDLPGHYVEPTGYNPIHSRGGRSELTKEIRSKTPIGFARAFFKANDTRT